MGVFLDVFEKSGFAGTGLTGKENVLVCIVNQVNC
jgi:hypothetical protein